MKDCSKEVPKMAVENCLTLTIAYTKENLRITKLTDMENKYMLMVDPMKDIGSTI